MALLAAAGGLLGTAGLAVLLYACSIHAIPGDSDGATSVLEAQAMLHGHVLLHGWALSLDSFWGVDTVIYGIMILVGGLRPGLLYAGPAVIATGVIVTGVLMAREGRRGAAAVAGGVTVVALLGLPTHALAYFFLRGPLHIGSAWWSLIAFAGLRKGRFGVGWAVAVLFLAAGMLGDLQTVALGVVPLGLAGLVAMARQRSWRAGVAQLSAAVAAAVLGEIVKKIRGALGGFAIAHANPTATAHQALTNVKHVITYGSEFFGVRNTLFSTGGVPNWLQDMHVVAGVIAGACFLAALVLLVKGVIVGPRTAAHAVGQNEASPQLWRLDDMLLIATFGPAAAFCVLAVTVDPQYTRYLTASVIFGSILAGRMVARVWPRLKSGVAAKVVASVGLALTLLLGAGVGYSLAKPVPGQAAGELAAWLEARHLDNGVADYWTGNLLTLQSHGRVTARPVVTGCHEGCIHRYPKQSAAQWYAGQQFQFFVWNTHIFWGGDDTVSATNTWGQPAHVYKVGPYWVLTWPAPIHVSPDPLPPG